MEERAQQINANKHQRLGNMNVRPADSTRLMGSAPGRREVHGSVYQCREAREAASADPLASLWTQLYDQGIVTSCYSCVHP